MTSLSRRLAELPWSRAFQQWTLDHPVVTHGWQIGLHLEPAAAEVSGQQVAAAGVPASRLVALAKLAMPRTAAQLQDRSADTSDTPTFGFFDAWIASAVALPTPTLGPSEVAPQNATGIYYGKWKWSTQSVPTAAPAPPTDPPAASSRDPSLTSPEQPASPESRLTQTPAGPGPSGSSAPSLQSDASGARLAAEDSQGPIVVPGGGPRGKTKLPSESGTLVVKLHTGRRINQSEPWERAQAFMVFDDSQASGGSRVLLESYGRYNSETGALTMTPTARSTPTLMPKPPSSVITACKSHTAAVVRSPSGERTPPAGASTLSETMMDITVEGRTVVTQPEDCVMNVEWVMRLFRVDLFQRRMLVYSVAMFGVAVVQLAAVGRQLEAALSGRGVGMSYVSVWMHGLIDSWFFLNTVFLFLQIPSALTLMILAFLKICLWGIYEHRLIMQILISRAGIPSSWPSPDPNSGFFKLAYWFLTPMITTLLFSFLPQTVMYPLVYSFWLPQIIFNVVEDTHRSLSPRYILSLSVSRLVFPLYWLACPAQFTALLRVDPVVPQTGLAVGVALWVGLQAVVLHLQDVRYPRFFVPKRFLPPQYDYFRYMPVPDDVETGAEQDACAICLSELDGDSGGIMVTPCEHSFHDECLRPWMERQMRCPTCRAMLPPVVPADRL